MSVENEQHQPIDQGEFGTPVEVDESQGRNRFPGGQDDEVAYRSNN